MVFLTQFVANNIGLKRIIAITNLAGLTKNLQKSSKEFVVHVLNEPDYWVNSEM